jgi:hypothetical protein
MEDAYYIFFEEASMDSGKGHISVIKMDDDGSVGSPMTVLERPFHLSYPHIIEWKGELYLIPESADNRTIDAYRCVEFPGQWELASTLMKDVAAHDTTIFEKDGIWWMFSNIQEHVGASTWDELCLFYSDSPIGSDWTPHPLNPVISDVRFARPAGNIFREDGRIFRPSQNSSYRYGYGLQFNEIDELSKTSYREHVVESFRPNWSKDVRAVHSYNRVDRLTTIDAIIRT